MGLRFGITNPSFLSFFSALRIVLGVMPSISLMTELLFPFLICSIILRFRSLSGSVFCTKCRFPRVVFGFDGIYVL